MALTDLLSRTVTIQTPTTATDRYHNTIDVWTAPASRSARAWWAQQNAIDDNDHRTATVTSGLMYFDLDAALVTGERVVLDGVTYDVVGEPNYAPTPRGPHHIECQLQAVAG